ncbi:hypothetical protein BKA82DRAFT_60127, partial [Pisolithus tinctorius]
EYLQHRIRALAARFFRDPEILMDVLRSCDAVISGSSALHLLLPASYTTWSPTDLDIYVPLRTFHYLTWLLNNHGYSSVSKGAINHSTYSYSKIASVYTFSDGVRTMDVVVSKTSAAFSPLFQFHSTALMNFVSHDRISCAYPSLTLHHLSLINPGLLYANCFSDKHIDALQKYVLRGF